MAPVLSPKKTWEGLAGGLVLAALVAVLMNRLGPVLPGEDLAATCFGLTVGGVGVWATSPSRSSRTRVPEQGRLPGGTRFRGCA